MSAPVVTNPPASPIALLYEGLTLQILGVATANLAAASSGIAFKVPLSKQALITHCIIDNFSVGTSHARLGSGLTLSYGYSSPGYGDLFSATFANISGQSVSSITINAGGTGYLTAPTVTLTSLDTGSGATAVATTDGDAVDSVRVVNPGHGYLVAPTVDVSGGGGADADLTAVIGSASLPGVPIIVLQPVGTARVGGGITINWAITNPVTGSGTCTLTWLGGLL